MLCERAQNLFSDYCEGTLQPAMLVAFEGHLKDCGNCREQVEGVRGVYSVMSDMPEVEAPADLRLRVWAKIDALEATAQPARSARWSFDWRSALMPRKLAMGMAAAVLLFMLGFVAPGRYTTAGFYFPWSLFASDRAWSIDVVQASTIAGFDRSELNLRLHLRAAGDKAVDLSVADRQGVLAEMSDVRLKAGANQSVTLTLNRTRIEGGLRLTVTRRDAPGAPITRPFQASAGR